MAGIELKTQKLFFMMMVPKNRHHSPLAKGQKRKILVLPVQIFSATRHTRHTDTVPVAVTGTPSHLVLRNLRSLWESRGARHHGRAVWALLSLESTPVTRR
jgi:hypothetical protein